MRRALIGLAGLVLVAACSKAPANTASSAAAAPQDASAQSAAAAPAAAVSAAPAAPAGAPVAGAFTANGKAAALTQVTAHADDPFDGKPITALVFTTKDQGGDKDAATGALFGKFGDAIVIKTEPDGSVVEAEVLHSGLKNPSAPVSISGVFTVKDYKVAGGQISGHLTSGGPTDVFGEKVDVDLTFHTAAP